jgi:hypothetical protein
MSETDAILRLICQYADQLGTKVLESVNQVVAEKKLLRKHYAEKRNLMDMELDRVNFISFCCDTPMQHARQRI